MLPVLAAVGRTAALVLANTARAVSLTVRTVGVAVGEYATLMARFSARTSRGPFRIAKKWSLKPVLRNFPRWKQGEDWLDLDTQTRRRWSIFSELKQRANAVSRMTPYVAAQETYWGVMRRIPTGPRWSSYSRSLTTVRFGSARMKQPVFGVYGEPRAFQSRAIDSARHAIYVRPKKSYFAPVPAEVKVLHKFSPWTMETLPFSPKKNEAVLVVRRVSKREIQNITRQRNKDKPEWRKLLEKAGVRNVRLTEKPVEVKTSVVNDLGFEALRLEFGYGGAKASPHWRPAVEESLDYVKRLYKSRGMFSKTMTDPRSFAWRKWPPRADSSIKISALKGIQKFQRRLKVRV